MNGTPFESGEGLRGWLMRNRTSVRLAFGLRLFAMAAGALLSLLWARLLVRAMGNALYGLFDTFLAVVRLGALGDMGLAGAISIKGGQMLGRKEDQELKKLLASARSLLLVIAGILFILFAALSPWLPQWLHFRAIPGTGSLSLLFIYGGVYAVVFLLGGYLGSLNYAHGTVTWPILPTLLTSQLLAPLLHWQLALSGAPLWLQHIPYLGAAVLNVILLWWLLKWSHPWLGKIFPLEFNLGIWKTLAATSGWCYLTTVGNVIYTTTDRLVINAGFGPEVLPAYRFNAKICDLALAVIISASFVSLPKITQWLASPEQKDRQRLLFELHRLNIFQIVLGCGAALGYLAFNDLFIRLWQGAEYNGPLLWQFAFAANLVILTGGEIGIQMAIRSGERDLKIAGLAVGGAGLLNLGLSILSAKLGSIAGIAFATVIAQSVLSVGLNRMICQRLGLSAGRWIAKTWLLPLAVVLAAALFKRWFPDSSLAHLGTLAACYTGLFLLACALAGVNREMLRSELAVVRSLLKI